MLYILRVIISVARVLLSKNSTGVTCFRAIVRKSRPTQTSLMFHVETARSPGVGIVRSRPLDHGISLQEIAMQLLYSMPRSVDHIIQVRMACFPGILRVKSVDSTRKMKHLGISRHDGRLWNMPTLGHKTFQDILWCIDDFEDESCGFNYEGTP